MALSWLEVPFRTYRFVTNKFRNNTYWSTTLASTFSVISNLGYVEYCLHGKPVSGQAEFEVRYEEQTVRMKCRNYELIGYPTKAQ